MAMNSHVLEMVERCKQEANSNYTMFTQLQRVLEVHYVVHMRTTDPNTNKSWVNDHINSKVKGNTKRHTVKCYNDYEVLQHNAKLAMLLLG